MISIILIILLIVSISKPDIFLSAKNKAKLSEEEIKKYANNSRKIYSIIIILFESTSLITYGSEILSIIGIIAAIVSIILFFKLSLPAIKENKAMLEKNN